MLPSIIEYFCESDVHAAIEKDHRYVQREISGIQRKRKDKCEIGFLRYFA